MAAPLKRFFLFSGDTYYPSGGWHDFTASYDTLEEAIAAAKSLGKYEWFHVIDSTDGEEVY